MVRSGRSFPFTPPGYVSASTTLIGPAFVDREVVVAGINIRRFEDMPTLDLEGGGTLETASVGRTTLGRARYEPGWKWSEHVGKRLGKKSCLVEHVGIVLTGRAVVAMDDGEQREIGPGDIFYIEPGHDFWVIGDEPYTSIHIEGAEDYGV